MVDLVAYWRFPALIVACHLIEHNVGMNDPPAYAAFFAKAHTISGYSSSLLKSRHTP
jgi:hypothetical protein